METKMVDPQRRILELARKAELLYYQDPSKEHSPTKLAAFAESIIADCVRLCDSAVLIYGNKAEAATDPVEKAEAEASRALAAALAANIKFHFGQTTTIDFPVFPE